MLAVWLVKLITPTSFNWRGPPLRSFEPMDYCGKFALVFSPTSIWKVIFWSSADVEMNITRICDWHQVRRWDSDGNYSFGNYSVHFVLIFNLLMMQPKMTFTVTRLSLFFSFWQIVFQIRYKSVYFIIHLSLVKIN